MTRTEVFSMIDKHWRKNHKSLVKRLTSATGSRHLAEEAVQEAYARACQYWKTYEERNSFDKWISVILSNSKKDQTKAEQLHGAINEGETGIAEVQHRGFNKVLVGDVSKIIDKEDEDIALILRCYFFRQMTTAEIADISSHNHDNIRKIVERFRKRMREEFKGQRLFA